jgi:alpha-ketoglutarate-dependent taurine dioxygenase
MPVSARPERNVGAGAEQVSVKPLTGVIGAEIHGVDLRRTLPDDIVALIRQALLDYFVVFFRDQDITVEQHFAFAARFGQISQSEYSRASEITVHGGKGFTDKWHSDSNWRDRPPLGAVLRAVSLPPVGGDTCFVSMVHAYEALSPSMQRFVDGLTAVHNNAYLNRILKDYPGGVRTTDEVEETIHPVVWVHPESDRKILYVVANRTVRVCELEELESDAVLRFLTEHMKSPQFQCRFRWEVNSIAFWDNRAVQHFAVSDYEGPRVMQRVLIAGDHRPVGPTPWT